ncbi:MAG TPA: YdeI/OmpD-associated family protein [Bacteroidia bacterium]|nr:YdeI/OmpD-associated family protein [Bacteroidia bacterium]HNT80872.1 YdeI/OmpD-associated family protein [Bacteroidia bacterium]
MRIEFETTILKFDRKGEKSGWTYITIPQDLSEELNPGERKSYRVKGTLDQIKIKQQALLPMGDGSFILPLNASLRKKLGKSKGALLSVDITCDKSEIKLDDDLLRCLEDVPEAKTQFESMSKSHQNYFSNWINSAKTNPTKEKRIGQCINAMLKKFDFGQMLREAK